MPEHFDKKTDPTTAEELRKMIEDPLREIDLCKEACQYDSFHIPAVS